MGIAKTFGLGQRPTTGRDSRVGFFELHTSRVSSTSDSATSSQCSGTPWRHAHEQSFELSRSSSRLETRLRHTLCLQVGIPNQASLPRSSRSPGATRARPRRPSKVGFHTSHPSSESDAIVKASTRPRSRNTSLISSEHCSPRSLSLLSGERRRVPMTVESWAAMYERERESRRRPRLEREREREREDA